MYRDNRNDIDLIASWAAEATTMMSQEDVVLKQATSQLTKVRSSGDTQSGRPTGDQKKIQGSGDGQATRLVLDA